MYVITTDKIADEIMHLAWQPYPYEDGDGYFWTSLNSMESILSNSTPEHPFIFKTKKEAIKQLKKLNIPQICRVVFWKPANYIVRKKIEEIRKLDYENWNHYNYERYNGCPCCDGKIELESAVNNMQTFTCKAHECGQRFILDAFTGSIYLLKKNS